MKNRLKKDLYIIPYIVLVLMGLYFDLNKEIKLNNLSIKLLNPLIFIPLSFIYLVIISKFIKKENYQVQKKVVLYFKTWNNLLLFLTILFSSNFFVSLITIFINLFFVYVIMPIPINPNVSNGVEDFFNEYPEHATNKFYKNNEEIKKEYKSLQEEVKVEIPVMQVKAKDEKKDKRKRVLAYIVPTIVIILIVVGISFSFVELFRKYNRGDWHRFTVQINGSDVNIIYREDYYRVIIPIFYSQKDSVGFYDNEKVDQPTTVVNSDKYVLDLKEYECINRDKGSDVHVACGIGALNETTKQVPLTKSKMKIKYDGNVIYNDDYVSDVTKYISEMGIYEFTITNKRNNITTTIRFNLDINLDINNQEEFINN